MWIPTLYFVEGIPYFLVNNVSVLMFAKMAGSDGRWRCSHPCFTSRGR